MEAAAGDSLSDYAAAARRFWNDGYVAIDGFFSRDVAAANHAWLAGPGADAPVWTDATKSKSIETDLDISIVLCDALSAPIRRIHADERFRALTGAILGADYSDLYAMLMRFKGPGAGGPWHQDCSSEIGAPYCMNRLIYPHDAGAAVGGSLVVVPGSHKLGRIPPGEPHGSMTGERVITPRAGTVVLMHASTFHRVSAVHSTVPRFSINLRAAPAGTSPAVTNVAVYRNVLCLFDQDREIPRDAGDN
jgi:ectoine hydroxylase